MSESISEFDGNEVFPEKKEECGLFAIYGDPDAVQKTYFGLHSLQHRGQEAAGIASSDGDFIQCYKNQGTVSRVFRAGSGILEKLANHMAIGHVRYSTTGSSKVSNSQPLLAEYSRGQVAVAHNGNLINAGLLRDEYEAYGSIFKCTSDTEIIVHLLAKPTHQSKPDPLGHVLNHLQGAYSVIFMFADHIQAARDPYGIKPLCIGRTAKGAYVIASESCAIDAIGAEFVREIEPGEIVRLDAKGLHSRFFVRRGDITPAHCIFEHVYFAKQNSRLFGENVHELRKKLGRQLAREYPVEADVVIPVPDSGTSAAVGYAEESGIPFDMGFVRSHYVGRTFISPNQKMREVDPTIKTIGTGEVGAGMPDEGEEQESERPRRREARSWSMGMLQNCADHMDLLSEHFYCRSRDDIAEHVAQIPAQIKRIADAHREFRARLPELQGKEDVPVALDEWNYWYGPHVFGELGTRYFLKDALGIAAGLHEYFRNTDVYMMANYAQTVNVIGCIKTTKTAADFDSTGLPLMLYRKQFGTVPLAVEHEAAPLDVSAALTADGETLTIGVVNPTWDTYQLRLDLGDVEPTGTAQTWVIAGDDPLAYNQPGEARDVDIATADPTDLTGTVAIKPLSITLFRAPVK